MNDDLYHAEDVTPKLRRVRRRRTRLWILALILLLLSPAAWMVFSVLTSKPAPNPAFEQQLRQLAEAQQRDPSTVNRHDELVAAIETFWNEQLEISELTLGEWRNRFPDNGDIPFVLDFFAPLADPEFPTERHLTEVQIAKNVIQEMESQNLQQPVFELLRHTNLANDYAVTDPHPVRYTPLWLRSNDEVTNLRSLTSFQIMRARLRLEAGESRAAAEILLETSLIPQYLSRQASMTEHLTALASAAAILKELASIATIENIDEQTLAILSKTLQQTQDLGDFSIALEGDLIGMIDSLHALHTKSGRIIPSAGTYLHDERAYYLDPPTRHAPTISERLGDMIGFAMASRDDNITFARQATDLILPAAETDDAGSRRQILRDYDLFTAARIDDLPLTGDALHSGTPKCIRSLWRTRSQFAAAGTILTMAEYRLDHADWPETLDQLIPDYIDAIPINPQTGRPIQYQHTPGEAPTLESFGVDL